MKLNIGCGGDYKEGYLNVDAFDSSVADKIMLAHDLKLDDNSFDEIYMSQLIEHLGIVGSIHSLSECFRVLKPGKKLVIETPDLRKSFEKYLNGDRGARKNILPWIYGVDIPGMVHRFCYPDDLLEETLQKIGFINIKKELFEIDQYEPVLKVICEKPVEYKIYQIMTFFRKKLLENNLIDLDDQITSLEKHDLVDFFTKKIKVFSETQDQDNLRKIIFDGAIRSPLITKLFLENLKTRGIVSKEFFEKNLVILEMLIDLNFNSILMVTMIQTPGFVGRQEELFSTIRELGIKTIEKLLQDENRDEMINKLKETSKSISSDDKIDFLSPKLIMLKSNRFFQIGVKEFILGNSKKAVNMFNKSACLHRGQFLSFWNLGRLYRLLKNDEAARTNYENTSELIDNLEHDNIENIKLFLKKEISDTEVSKYSNPVTSLKEF